LHGYLLVHHVSHQYGREGCGKVIPQSLRTGADRRGAERGSRALKEFDLPRELHGEQLGCLSLQRVRSASDFERVVCPSLSTPDDHHEEFV
jgi:hypothetical protein